MREGWIIKLPSPYCCPYCPTVWTTDKVDTFFSFLRSKKPRANDLPKVAWQRRHSDLVVSRAGALNLLPHHSKANSYVFWFFFPLPHRWLLVLGWEPVLRTFFLLVDLHKQWVAWCCKQEDISHCQSIYRRSHMSGSWRRQGKWPTLGREQARMVSLFTFYVFMGLKLYQECIIFITQKSQWISFE